MRDLYQYRNLPEEVEARWRLVETSWHLELPRRALAVTYEHKGGLLVVEIENRRATLTGCHDALNGYQKGHCFYCQAPISVDPDDQGAPVHVDHFHPFTLSTQGFGQRNVDWVWNLVLACQDCNLSKLARVPTLRFLEKLSRRNDYLITSHHPLRSTLMLQTGTTQTEQRNFLQAAYNEAVSLLIHKWEPEQRQPLTL